MVQSVLLHESAGRKGNQSLISFRQSEKKRRGDVSNLGPSDYGPLLTSETSLCLHLGLRFRLFLDHRLSSLREFERHKVTQVTVLSFFQ